MSEVKTSMNIPFPKIPESKSLEEVAPETKVVTSFLEDLPTVPSSEVITEKFKFKSYQDIVSNMSLDNEIVRAGYKILYKVVVDNNKEKRAKYIKAVNSYGQEIFILLDNNGYTLVSPEDILATEESGADIPNELRNMVFFCADNNVCGVAFECNGKVCTITGPHEKTEEKSFITQKIKKEYYAIYPIVRFSEIKTAPDVALRNTDLVLRRLRNSLYNSLVQELLLTQKAIEELAAAFVTFDGLRKSTANKLSYVIEQLEKWNNTFLENPPTTDKEKRKHQLIKLNLQDRHERAAELLTLMEKVVEKRALIANVTKDITEVNQCLQDHFNQVDIVIFDK
ncbi:MAG: hypothetical protein QXV60_03705 [Nitrososphaerota archaeon]